ncbi:MAG: sugar transporter substrate-binding protein [Pseudomonas sp.]|nr:sugar transporter substrate-binding protein [Pseudomonas sp.]
MKAPQTVTSAQEQAALAWFIRLHDQPSGADQLDFSHWLQADPAHAEAYSQAQVVWELSEGPAGKLAAEDSSALSAYLQSMTTVRRPLGWGWSSGLAMAACLLLMISMGAGWQPQRWFDDLGADYRSEPGVVKTVVLADKSQVTLDADSAIDVNFSGGERHVRLRRGAAFFNVTHTGDAFVVSAQSGEVRVLGTQFEVRLQPDGARVTVLSGRVGVTAAAGQPQQVLGTGQQVAFDGRTAGELRMVDSENQLAWRQGWLNYYKTPLAEVVKDLGRYYPGRIVLLNDELGAKRVSGSFPSKDPEAVLAALKSVVGFEQYSLLGRVIVLR